MTAPSGGGRPEPDEAAHALPPLPLHHPLRRQTWRHPAFRLGMREMLPLSVGVASWGLVTGVAMAKSGMGLALASLMSVLVFAGSAQLATIPLFAAGAPLWVIWLTTACVNLRFVIFSATWRPYLVHHPRGLRVALAYFTADLNFVMFMRRFPQPRPSADQLPYFWGGAVLNWSAWQTASFAGMLLADVIPRQWDLGFAGILALVGLIGSLMAGRAMALAAAVAGAAALATQALPLRLNIVVAVVAAVAISLLLDAGRRAPR